MNICAALFAVKSPIRVWRRSGKSGVCMLGAKKQKAWFSDQSFAKRFGFEVVDATDSGYELLALSFDGTVPRFAQNAKKQEIEGKELTVYYDMQCPYVFQSVEMIRQYCETNDAPVSFIQVDTLQRAKELPCVFVPCALYGEEGDLRSLRCTPHKYPSPSVAWQYQAALMAVLEPQLSPSLGVDAPRGR